MNTKEKQILEGYKETEIGSIPSDWDLSTLEDITQKKRPVSYGIVQTGPTVYDGIPCLRVLDIVNGSINPENLITTTQRISDAYSRTKLRENDLVMPLRGKVGEVGIIGQELVGANLTRGVALIALEEKYIPRYVKQALCSESSQSRLLNSMSGSALQEISIGTLRSFKLPIPKSLNEQTAIANALTDTDSLICELKKLIAKKQAIKTATMQQLLTGKKRLSEFALHTDGEKKGQPKGMKRSELGEIPEDWDAIKMGELANIQRGASPRPIDSPIWFDRNSEVGWLRISDVTRTSKYLTETTQGLSKLGIENSRYVPSGNLVMSICATVGKPILTRKHLCIHDGFVVFKNLHVEQNFMYYALKDLENEWGKQGQTGSQMNLNTDLINRTYVAIPRLEEEQTTIATILSDMDEEIQKLKQRLSKTRQIKQGMMQELLTGRTRLPFKKD